MRMTFKAFSKALFGVKYEKLTRTIFIYLLMFWGLRIADFKVRITLPVLYIMATAVTTGVMWQALSSENNAANIQSMVMLPVERRKFVFPYIAALGIYTFLTKTAALLAVLLAVSVWSWMEILGSILCAVNAILMTAAVFSLKNIGMQEAYGQVGKSLLFYVCGTSRGLFYLLQRMAQHRFFCCYVRMDTLFAFRKITTNEQ